MELLGLVFRPEAGRDRRKPLLLRGGRSHGVEAGFPRSFDRLDSRLIGENKRENPQILVTTVSAAGCSCNQFLPHKVLHLGPNKGGVRARRWVRGSAHG